MGRNLAGGFGIGRDKPNNPSAPKPRRDLAVNRGTPQGGEGKRIRLTGRGNVTERAENVQRQELSNLGIKPVSSQVDNIRRQDYAREERDVTSGFQGMQALFDGKPEQVEDWRNIASNIVRMQEVGAEPEAIQYVMNAGGDDLRPHIEALAGPDWWEKHYRPPPPPESSWWKDAAKTTFALLDATQQRLVQAPILAATSAIDREDGVSPVEALFHALRQPVDLGVQLLSLDQIDTQDASEITRFGKPNVSADQDKSGDLNLREALGLDADSGGTWADVFDWGFRIAVDPLNFIGGAGALTKTSLKGIQRGAPIAAKMLKAERALATHADEIAKIDAAILQATEANGRRITREIGRVGFKGLSEDDKFLASRFLHAWAQDAAERTGRTTTRKFLGGADRYTEAMAKIERGGQKGLHVFGRTVIPTKGKLTDLIRGKVIYRVKPAAEEAANDGVKALVETVQGGEMVPQRFLGEMVEVPNIKISYNALDDGIDLVDQNGVRHFLDNKTAKQFFGLLDDPEVAALIKHADDPPAPEVLQRLALPAGEGTQRTETIREILQEDQYFWGHADRQNRVQGKFASGRTGSELQLGRATEGVHVDEGLGRRPMLDEAPAPKPRRTPHEAKVFLGHASRRRSRPTGSQVGSFKNPRAMPVRQPIPDSQAMELYRGAMDVPRPGAWDDRRNWRLWSEAGRDPDMLELPAGAVRESLTAGADDALPTTLGRLVGGDRTPGLRPMLEAAPDELIDETIELVQDIPRLADRDEWLTVAERNMKEWERHRFQQGALGNLMDFSVGGRRPFRALSRAMGPFSVLKAMVGDDIADDVARLVSEGRELHEYEHLLSRIGMDSTVFGWNHKTLFDDALKEFGGNEEEFWRMMNDVLTDEDQLDEILGAGGKLADDASFVHRYVHTLDAARREIRAAAIRGGADPAHLHDIDTYLPRVLTAKARRNTGIVDEVGDAARQAANSNQDTRLGDGFLKQRTIATEQENLFDVNEEVAQILSDLGVEGVEVGDEIFTTNIAAAFAARGRPAFQAAADVDLMESITRIDGFGGGMMGYRIPAGHSTNDFLKQAGQKRGDFVIKTLPNGEAFAIHKEIAEELADIRRIFGDVKEQSKFLKSLDAANNVWAGWATVPRPAFHMRNLRSNVFLAHLGGLNNPAHYRTARKLQILDRRATELVRKEGIPYREALARIGDDTVEGRRFVEATFEAQRLGVMDGGQGEDILKTHIRDADPIDKGVHSGANPLNPKNKGIQAGREVAQRVENNARLALFWDQIQKGATYEDAAAHVKKYLFDYGQLTGFESGALRRIARFYTFTRKNVALQFETLARMPARARRAQMINEGAMNAITGEPDDDGTVLPPWFQHMAGLSRRSFNGETVALNTDTPLNQFFQMAQVAIDGGAMVSGKDQGPFEDESNARKFWGGLSAQFSGIGPGLYDFLQEQDTGRDAFSGRELTDMGFWGLNKDSGLTRFAEVFVPYIGEIHRMKERGVIPGYEGDEGKKRSLSVNIMNQLFGIGMTPLEYSGEDREVQSMMYELDNMINEWNESAPRDEQVPTLAEMREEGDLQMRDRLAEAVLYSWVENEDGTLSWSTDVYDDRILNMIPKAVRVALQLPEPGSRAGANPGAHPEMTELEWDEKQTEDALAALDHWFQERHDRPMTEGERLNVWLTLPGNASNEFLKDEGIETWRDPAKNRFLPDPAEDDRTAEMKERMDMISRQVGLSPATVRAMAPLLEDLDRAMLEGERAGLSPQEIIQQMSLAPDEGGVGGISRAARAYLNQIAGGSAMEGPWSITATRTPIFGDEEEEKAIRKARTAENMIRTLYAVRGLGTPSPEAIQTFVVNMVMTGPELDLMGFDNLRGAKNREDIRSDEQKAIDAAREARAAQVGAGILP